jgi:hypothetical protein
MQGGRRRVRDRERGSGADRVRVGADLLPVGRVQRRPAARSAERGGDARQGVSDADRVADRGPAARHDQDRAGADEPRVGADDLPVGRVQGRPAAGGTERGSDARQAVARLHEIRARASRTRHSASRPVSHVAGQGGLNDGVTRNARNAGVRLGRAEGPRRADRRHDEQDAPGERHARGPSPHAHGAVTFLPRMS